MILVGPHRDPFAVLCRNIRPRRRVCAKVHEATERSTPDQTFSLPAFASKACTVNADAGPAEWTGVSFLLTPFP